MKKFKGLMWIIWLLVILFWVAGIVHGAAPTLVEIDGSTSWERARVLRLEQRLNFTQEPMVDDWSITIWPQEQFEKYVREHKLPTDIAFTSLGDTHTFINEYFLVWASDPQAEFVLAHEAGHLICECGDSKGSKAAEDKADEIAHVLTGFYRPPLEH